MTKIIALDGWGFVKIAKKQTNHPLEKKIQLRSACSSVYFYRWIPLQ